MNASFGWKGSRKNSLGDELISSRVPMTHRVEMLFLRKKIISSWVLSFQNLKSDAGRFLFIQDSVLFPDQSRKCFILSQSDGISNLSKAHHPPYPSKDRKLIPDTNRSRAFIKRKYTIFKIHLMT